MQMHNNYLRGFFVGIISFITTACVPATPALSPERKLVSPTENSVRTPEVEMSELIVRIPAQSDWVDYGMIFEAGAEGEWDYYLWGGFALSAIKKNGTYYLYYL
jgi:hypothetical protein